MDEACRGIAERRDSRNHHAATLRAVGINRHSDIIRGRGKPRRGSPSRRSCRNTTTTGETGHTKAETDQCDGDDRGRLRDRD